MAENRIRARTMCRIGFVGTGGVAARHAEILGSFDDAAVTAVTDVDSGRAAAFAHSYGGSVLPDVAALTTAGLDAVYVCVPPFAHGEIEVTLAEAGIPLFVEKPLGIDETAAQRVSDRITATGVLSRVGHHWRCAEPVRRARELLAGREVRLVSGSWLDKIPPVPWWRDRATSGGPVVEQAVHVLDLARTLVGEVEEVHAASAGPLEDGASDAAVAALLRFATGAVGTVTTSCVLAGKLRAGLEIVADGCVIGVGEDWLGVGDGLTTRYEKFEARSAQRAADREFVDAVHGEPVIEHGLPDHAEAMASHRLACAVARSARSGHPVRM